MSHAIALIDILSDEPALMAFVQDRFRIGAEAGVFESHVGGPNGNESCVYAVTGRAYLGFATFHRPYDEQAFIWIGYLWVEPAHRGRGIARQLVRTVEQTLSDGGRVAFGTLAPNSSMLQVAEKLGYGRHAITLQREVPA